MPKLSFNIKIFEKQSFMLSIYAETLRFFVQIFATRCLSHTVVHVNNWLLPKNKISMMSSHPTHMNPEIWNIKNGVYFFDNFWIERFLIDFKDPENNAIKINIIYHENTDNKNLIYNTDKVRFSLENLKSLWTLYENKYSSYSLHVHMNDGSAEGYLICSGKNFANQVDRSCAGLLPKIVTILVQLDTHAMWRKMATWAK